MEGGESGFGHFDDIVSVSSEDQRFFRIGFAEVIPSQDEDGNKNTECATTGFLFTYTKVEGMPKLHKCTHNYGKRVVTITYTEKTIRYKIYDSDHDITINDFQDGLFDTWVDIHNTKTSSGYKIIKDEIVNSDNMPALYALSFIREVEIEPSPKRKGRRFFAVPGPSFGGNVTWIVPIRTKPRRTYDEIRLEFSPEGEHTPYIVKKILDSGEKAKLFQSFMARFGKESGLFKEVNVHRFGSSVTSPFELEVVLEAKPLNISNVGYGVSQGLPVVVELFVRESGTWFAIQVNIRPTHIQQNHLVRCARNRRSSG